MRYFSSKRDAQIIASGGFSCLGCLVGRPADDQSVDPRYCVQCYDVLSAEAKELPANRRPRWVPCTARIAAEKPIPVPTEGLGIMATVESPKSTVAMNGTPRRGRKHRTDIPVDEILSLHAEGLGSKRIARKLADAGTVVGFRTVARVLSGERE